MKQRMIYMDNAATTLETAGSDSGGCLGNGIYGECGRGLEKRRWMRRG
ncbi:MAG: hypothetical protein ACLR2O_09055 [Coprococcus sp.]